MKHLMYFPAYAPAPAKGSWIYLIAYAYEQSFHSCGTVTRTGDGGFNNETFVEFESKPGQKFSNRPIS